MKVVFLHITAFVLFIMLWNNAVFAYTHDEKRIMNKIRLEDGTIKHISQEILLNNLDAYARERGRDRIYVTNPEGKCGTVELRELKDVLDAGYQLVDDTEGYNNRPDIIEKRIIYNRIIEPDGSIKHINQQDVLDNIDAIHDAKIRDRIAVIFPDGDTGTIEAWELKNALKEGYQLVDDTEGYNNRPDIIEKRKTEQPATPQVTALSNLTNIVKNLKDSKIYIHLTKIFTMNNLIIPLCLLFAIVLIIFLSNKENQKFFIINDNTWRWVKIIIALTALYIAYLFALNGRYTSKHDYIHNSELEFRDKWNIQ